MQRPADAPSQLLRATRRWGLMMQANMQRPAKAPLLIAARYAPIPIVARYAPLWG